MSKQRESDIMAAIRLALSDSCDLMRNNCGVARMADGSTIRYGLGNPGGADLIGLRRSDGRFVAIECKTPTGRVSPEQERFLARVRASGGIAAVVRSVEDALVAVEAVNG